MYFSCNSIYVCSLNSCRLKENAKLNSLTSTGKFLKKISCTQPVIPQQLIKTALPFQQKKHANDIHSCCLPKIQTVLIHLHTGKIFFENRLGMLYLLRGILFHTFQLIFLIHCLVLVYAQGVIRQNLHLLNHFKTSKMMT